MTGDSTSSLDARLAAFEALWEDRRAGRPLPDRKDFLAEDFAPWFGHVCIVRLEPDSGRYRMTLCGTTAADYFGRDITGRFLDEEFPPHRYPWVDRLYRECAETRRPTRYTSPPHSHDGTYRALSRVLAPCGRGDSADTFLLCIYAVA